MGISDRIKNHIYNNRGKYGAAGAVGTVVAANEFKDDINSNASQLAYNTLAKGHNLVQDGKEFIGAEPGTKIDPEAIDATNAYYNSLATKVYNPNPIDAYNNSVTLSESNGVISLPVKQMLTEGYAPEEITESLRGKNTSAKK